MRFVDEYRSNEKVQTLLEAIRKKVTRPWYIMEICGGQTHAIARYRLEEMLPPDLQLLHGPGCPVCVTPVETIDYALKLATQPNVILASFGDMMRVPGSKEDLLSVKARGADIRMLYTPLMPYHWPRRTRIRKSYSSQLVLRRPHLFTSWL